MLKFTYLVQLGLAGALTLPAWNGQDGSLSALMSEIDAALAELSRGLTTGDSGGPGVVERALRLSEPPLAGERERDELLALLRRDVGALQQELDELEVLGTDPRTGTAHQEPKVDPTTPRTGLGDAERERLRPFPQTSPTGARTVREPIAFEGPGYSADPIRHGRAYVRAGRHAEGLALLERHQGSPQADFWRARCLEGLGRLDEALRAYEGLLATLEPDADLHRRAREERDFVSWRIAFEGRLAERRTP